MSLSYRNQFIDFHSISTDCFLYDRDLRHEKVKWWSKFERKVLQASHVWFINFILKMILKYHWKRSWINPLSIVFSPLTETISCSLEVLLILIITGSKFLLISDDVNSTYSKQKEDKWKKQKRNSFTSFLPDTKPKKLRYRPPRWIKNRTQSCITMGY